mgnify:CR=1 FL=1|nr:MAG TPA: hypothetical protein [Caudoviricetes sp.]
MTDTHGLVMHGLEKAVECINSWPRNSGGYCQVSYDMDTGEVWASDFIDEGSRLVYHNPHILNCGTYTHTTEQTLADRIYGAVDYYRHPEKYK